jgi:hypothetical protein
MTTLELFADDIAAYSPADSPASRSRALERGWAEKMTASSGLTCSALLKRGDPIASLVKTLLGSTAWDSTTRLMIWRPSATRLRRRLKFQLVALEPSTSDTDSGLLATPTATANQLAPSMANNPGCKAWQDALCPTPNATAFKGGRLKGRKGKANPEMNNYQDFCSLALGMRYPMPEFGEQIMGYRLGWTYNETWRSGTQSSRKSPTKSLGHSDE